MKQINRAFSIGSRALCTLILVAGMSKADPGEQTAKLTADFSAYFDSFGHAVAISGHTAIIGAPFASPMGGDSGAAYLFDASTGEQFAKLLPNDGASKDVFGLAVAISGTLAIVGAHGDDDNGDQSGAAYIFDTVTGLQTAKLLPSDGASLDIFGGSVAISDSRALVGAKWDDDNGTSSGSAYLFDASSGMQIAKLLPSDGASGDAFGSSVAISGATAIIGADGAGGVGAAYLFDVNTGLELGKLIAGDGFNGDRFGEAVDISGTTAIVGARYNDALAKESGAAYLFDAVTGVQVAKLVPTDGTIFDNFGLSVGIHGTTAIVGSFGPNLVGLPRTGSAYLFDTVTGMELGRLNSNDGESGDYFGESVSLSGAAVIVGAYGVDSEDIGTGAAYVFEGAGPNSMSSDVASISLSAGGQQLLTLNGGAQRAGWFYWIFGSASGTAPGMDLGGGVVLPLNYDTYFQFTLNKPFAAIYSNSIGVLNANGVALAANMLPPGSAPGLVGTTLYHCYLATPNFPGAEFASNAVAVQLIQ